MAAKPVRRLAGIMGTIGAVVVLAGCWPAPGQNPDRTAHNPFESTITPANVGELTEAWSVQPLAGTAMGAPTVSPSGVHAVIARCALVTAAPATGDVRWVAAVGGGPIDGCAQLSGLVVYPSPPFVHDDRVAAGLFWWLRGAPSPQFGTLTSDFDAATGQPNGGPGIVAGMRDGHVLTVAPYIATLNGIPFGPYGPFKYATVKPLGGSGQTMTIASTTTGGIGPDPVLPTLGRDALFHGSLGTLATAPGDPAVGMSVRAYPRTGAQEGCGPADGLVTCPLWSTPVTGGVTTSPVLAPDQTTVHVGTSTGDVYALDAADGSARWTTALGSAVRDEPALAGGVLYVPLADGRLAALSAADGSVLWTAAIGSSIDVQPAVAGGVVFTGSADGTLHAFDAGGCGAASCDPLWTAATGSAITGAPALSGGTLYAGTADGRLVAYR